VTHSPGKKRSESVVLCLQKNIKSYIYINKRLKKAIGHKATSYKAVKKRLKKAIGY